MRFFLLCGLLLALAACEPVPVSTSPTDRSPEQALRAIGRPIALATKIADRCPRLERRIKSTDDLIELTIERMKDLGYAEWEIAQAMSTIDSRVENKVDWDYLKSQGVDRRSTASICAYGEKQIAERTAISRYIKRR